MPASAPDFVRHVTARMMEGLGDDIPVSAMPVDGTFPSGTAAWEKRNIAEEVPVWEPDLCVQCGQCSFVCPHSVIRAKYYDADRLAGAPDGFKSAPINARGYPDVRFTLQFYVEDCTGCGLCIEACPAHQPGRRRTPRRSTCATSCRCWRRRRANIAFFETLPINDRARVDFANVRGVQFLEPLFEFSGACAGCGETPYLKLLSQLFGDRMMVANATGCSSIYGGNLPVTPWIEEPAKAAGRPGRIRCSRTTPSSASASAWPPTSIWSWRPALAARPGAEAGRRSWSTTILHRAADCGNPKSAPSASGWRR